MSPQPITREQQCELLFHLKEARTHMEKARELFIVNKPFADSLKLTHAQLNSDIEQLEKEMDINRTDVGKEVDHDDNSHK